MNINTPDGGARPPQGGPGAEPAPVAAAPADDTGNEAAARRLLAEAGVVLQSRAANAPPDFVARLFALAAPEDLVRYEPAELAEIAAGTWRFLGERKPRTPKIRVGTAPPNFGHRLKNVSIIELVNDDMPFLVDSVMAELGEQGLEAHLVAHPRFTVERDATGKLVALAAGAGSGRTATRESVIQVHVDRIDDQAVKNAIVAALASVLAAVRQAVDDWRTMLARLTSLMADLKNAPPALPVDEIAESIQFLEWLMDDNFTFLGVRDYRLTEDGNVLTPVSGSSLGILGGRDGDAMALDRGRIEMKPRAVAALNERRMLIITKTASRSRVHRRVAMDNLVVKHYDRDGALTGAFQIVGLFTSTAYVRSTRSIPYLRRKVASVISRAGFEASSHSGKAIANVLETYPRDELFQIDEELLFRFALTVLELNERPRVRVLPRRDAFERFVSVLVYVPRDRYDSAARAAIGRLLAAAFGGRVASFAPFFPEGPVARVHFIIARQVGELAGELAHPHRAELESAVTRLVKTWPDGLAEALAAAHDPVKARALFATYGGAFSAAYREAFTPATAVNDIAVIEALSSDFPFGVDFQTSDG